MNPSEIARVNACARTCKPQDFSRAISCFFGSDRLPKSAGSEHPKMLVGDPRTTLDVQAQQIRVELFSYRQEMRHDGNAHLTAKQSDEMSKALRSLQPLPGLSLRPAWIASKTRLPTKPT